MCFCVKSMSIDFMFIENETQTNLLTTKVTYELEKGNAIEKIPPKWLFHARLSSNKRAATKTLTYLCALWHITIETLTFFILINVLPVKAGVKFMKTNKKNKHKGLHSVNTHSHTRTSPSDNAHFSRRTMTYKSWNNNAAYLLWQPQHVTEQAITTIIITITAQHSKRTK